MPNRFPCASKATSGVIMTSNRLAGSTCRTSKRRFLNAKGVMDHDAVSRIAQKEQMPFAEGMNNRKVNLFSLLPEGFYQRFSVDFTVKRQKQRNTLRILHFRVFSEPLVNPLSGELLLIL